MRERPVLFGSLIVVLAASGFGLLGPLARFAFAAGFDPLSFVAWRATFGLLIVLVVVAARTRRGVRVVRPSELSTADRLALVLVGLAGLGLNVAMFYAFDITSVAIALLAFYTYPALVALVAAVLGHEHLDANRLAALALALLGMVLVVAGGLGATSGVTIQPLGVLLGLVAAGWQTVFVTVSRGRFTTVSSEQAMAWILGITAASCAVITFVVGGNLGVVASRPDALGIAALTGVVAAGIPSVMFLVGIRTIGGTRAGILMLFEPLVGVTLAAVLLGESLGPIQLIGGLAILTAAIVIQRSGGPAPAVQAIEPAAVPSVEPG